MRFHHSTRRGRNRLSQQSQQHSGQRAGLTTSGWSKLGYCRETNIHFNRRLPVDPPQELKSTSLETTSDLLLGTTKLVESAEMGVKKSPLRELRHREQQLKIEELKLNRLSLREQHQVEPAPNNERVSAENNDNGNNQTKLDLESARQRLVAQVSKHPFWSSKAAKKMHLTGLQERRIYIYELISYCERRDLEWRFEPYRGGLVSSIPHRRLDGVAADGSLSQPASPSELQFRQTRSGSVRTAVPMPAQIQNNTDTPDWLPSSSQATRRSPVRRSCSGTTATSGSSATSTPNRVYEPTSALAERQIPCAEIVWSVEVPARARPSAFAGCVYSSEMPNSSFVKRCHGCQGRGRLKCNSCHGVGYEVCISCSGKGTTRNQGPALGGASMKGDRYGHLDASISGRNSTSASGHEGSDFATSSESHRSRGNEPGGITSASGSSAWFTESCHFCHGAGQKRCWVCAGKSYNHCMGCLGAGQLRCFLNLNVTWLNHRDETFLNNADNIIPKDRLRLCSGLLLTDETNERLQPLVRDQMGDSSGLVDEANQLYLASRKLLERHEISHKQERLLKQRHKVTQIDCHIVNYEWKQRRGHFVIYGDEKKVYIAKYPFKSICNIT